MKRSLVALVVLGLIALPTARARAASGVQFGHLENGAAYTLIQNASSPTVALGLWFRAPASGYDYNQVGIADLAARALADEPIAGGLSLRQRVAHNGGTLQIEIAPNLLGISVVVPTAVADTALHALSLAYLAGKVDAKTLVMARAETGVRAVEERFNIENDLQERLFGALFTSGPLHAGVYPRSAASLDSVALPIVNAFATRAFRPGNASFSLVGDVGRSVLTQIAAANAAGSDEAIDSAPGAAGKTIAESGSTQAIALGFVGPPISSQSDATALDFVASIVLDHRLGMASALPPKSVAVAHFVTLHGAGIFMMFAVGNDSATMRATLLADIARLRNPLSAARFQALRRAFAFHIASSTLLPQDLADNLGWYSAAGNAAYAPGVQGGQYAQSLAALTPARIAAVVRRYLVAPTTIDMSPALQKNA